jgi:hypothetical protein
MPGVPASLTTAMAAPAWARLISSGTRRAVLCSWCDTKLGPTLGPPRRTDAPAVSIPSSCSRRPVRRVSSAAMRSTPRSTFKARTFLGQKK